MGIGAWWDHAGVASSFRLGANMAWSFKELSDMSGLTIGGQPEALRKQLARALERVAGELGLNEAPDW